MSWLACPGWSHEASALAELHDLLSTSVVAALLLAAAVGWLVAGLRAATGWRWWIASFVLGAAIAEASAGAATDLACGQDERSGTRWDHATRRGWPLYFAIATRSGDSCIERHVDVARFAIDALFWSGAAALALAVRRARRG